ncbi:MAG: response regulator transcription factor [Anaerolineales bacterium]|nr:response regulator transcription factor [Anaerolineales bacterium]
MRSKKSAFIISNYLMFQRGLKNLLVQQAKIEIVGATESPDQAIEQVKSLHPDVVILDSTNMPGDPLVSLKHIFHAYPHVKVICLNLHSNQLAIYQAVQQRAMIEYRVFKWKVEDIADLFQAISYNFRPSPLITT